MKTQSISKNINRLETIVDQKNPQFRTGAKTSDHRYERRKIREQLRHLDWALAGVD